MELEMEIICTKFSQYDITDNEIETDEASEEYYIIPLSRDFGMGYDDKVTKLYFKNQLLLLKYSNHKGIIHLKEYDCFNQCVLIKSSDILDIYVKIDTSNYMRKNVWQSRNIVSMNKKYLGKKFLMLPIIEDMVDIHSYGEGILRYQIHVITNEVIMKEVLSKQNNHGYLGVTNNFLLNKDALFILLYDVDVEKFFPHP